MTAALIKATELINAQVRRKRETKRRKSVSASERGRLERQAQMQSAFGGGDDSPGGYENEDPDDVLRMICGVGGMTYREVENGQIVGGNEEASADGGGGKGSGNASIDRLFDEVKAMREEQQSDAAFTARRIEKLEVAMMRSNGMEQRDPSALVRRPHVQRALRVCAVLNTALHHWRRRARDLHLLGAACVRAAVEGAHRPDSAPPATLTSHCRHTQLPLPPPHLPLPPSVLAIQVGADGRQAPPARMEHVARLRGPPAVLLPMRPPRHAPAPRPSLRHVGRTYRHGHRGGHGRGAHAQPGRCRGAYETSDEGDGGAQASGRHASHHQDREPVRAAALVLCPWASRDGAGPIRINSVVCSE